MALVSPSNNPVNHPLDEFRRVWVSSSKAEKENFDYSHFRAETMAYLDTLSNLGACHCIYNPENVIDCYCLANLDLTEEEAEGTVDYLIRYFKLPFSAQRSLVHEWKRYAKTLAKLGQTDRTLSPIQTYLLPGSYHHRLCKNSLAKLIGKSRFAWDSIELDRKEAHGHSSQKPNNRIPENVVALLNEYFFSLSRLGQPRATKIIRQLSPSGDTVMVELKATDNDLIELPACHTKRALYRTFLQENGWEVAFDNKSRMSAVGEGPPLSWPTFCSYWKENYPLLTIQPRSADICDDCVVFANRHKYLSTKKGDNDEHQEPLRDAEEDLIIAAGKHVEMARIQRLLFVSKKEEAKLHAAMDMPQEQRTYTFVADFAQNMYIPNFAAEQPGATYYYSPLNVYPFGVVDASTTPTMLTAFVFSEGT
jgi:hypothetical protein